MVGLVASVGLEQVEFAGFRLHNLHNLAESVAVGCRTFQLDGYVARQHRTQFQVDVTERTVGVAAPNQFVAGIDFKRIRALTPSGELDAQVVDFGRTL